MEENKITDPIYLEVNPLLTVYDDNSIQVYFNWKTLTITEQDLTTKLRKNVLLQLFCIQMFKGLLDDNDKNNNDTRSNSLSEYSLSLPSNIKITKKQRETIDGIIRKFEVDAWQRHIDIKVPMKKPKKYKFKS
jgi:hypothetical protein